jgi:hypothetical protein
MKNKNMKSIIINHFLIPLLAMATGILIGINWDSKPKKKYPIEVQCYWATSGYISYPQMECDSIHGDTLWKDGNKIVAKNIINIEFQ